ncbi:MAG: extracellular substrate binding-like orphan protein GrrP [Cyanobium sp.]
MPRPPLPRLLPAVIGLLAILAPLAPARAETVVSRVARSGQLVVTGVPGNPPLLSLGSEGAPQGYAMAIIDQVGGELSRALGRPVKVRFLPAGSTTEASQAIASGKADLACGFPFSWDQDQQLDYSLPIGLSGLRLLAPTGRFDGSTAALRGRRIGVVRDSLAESELKGMQPAAVAVGFPTLAAAVSALSAGSLDGVIGDTLLLASLSRSQRAGGLSLTPEEPFERYAIACALPENDSAFRNLVNLAIARLLQGYLDGNPEAVSAIDRWVGPQSGLGVPSERIRAYFESVLLGVEAIRSGPTGVTPPAQGRAGG